MTAYQVCLRSMLFRSSIDLNIKPLMQHELRAMGLYTRPELKEDGKIIDVISKAPMSTEFAITRFLVPYIAETGWALFCDSDFLFRTDIYDLFALRDDKYAVMVVKHDHKPDEKVKMNGQEQTSYYRKNWSSLMLFNCDHPANKALDLKAVNNFTGLDLHSFKWLADDFIGELPVNWNWLEGSGPENIDPHAVHFTRGTPDMPGYEQVAYAREWLNIKENINAFWQAKA